MAQDFRGGDDGNSMLLVSQSVTRGRKARETALPPELAAGATILAQLTASGIVGQVEERFRVARRGGHDGLALLAFAVLYLSAGPQSSIRRFAAAHAARFPEAAAIVGRRALPTAASVSRALSGLERSTVEPFIDQLLSMPVGWHELLSHPTVAHRDAAGQPWHVFDFDPTTRPFRQRELISGPDLPDGQRKVEAVPGYVGRKRGEVRQQDHLLQHAGSGLWISYRLNATGGSAHPYLASAVAAARRATDQIQHPADRTLVRADGEFGHARAVRACAEHGVHHLVRLARYHLFQREDVQATLASAQWLPVPDSGIGKMAADLGTVVLHDTDGEGPPVSTRVIVTRFRAGGTEPQHGVLQDGFQLETFATSLPPEFWSAADVAQLYAGRNSIENSFAQEDRELGLERTFSYSAAGQALFVAVGLFLWNHAICSAAKASPPPTRLPAQSPRPEQALPEPAPEAPPSVDTAPCLEHAEVPPPPDAPEHEPGAGVKELLSEAAAGRVLRPGWRLDTERGVLRCPADKPVHVYHAETTREVHGCRAGTDRISLRTTVGACDGCALRPTCFSSPKSNAYKQLTWGLPHDLAGRFKVALAAERGHGPPRRSPPRILRRIPASSSTPLFTPPPVAIVGPLYPAMPTFSPGAARRRTRDAVLSVQISIRVSAPRRRKAAHPLVRSVDERRANRLTWRERGRRARLAAEVVVFARGPAAARSLLAIQAG